MRDLVPGVTRDGDGLSGVVWDILGQACHPKALTEWVFAFEILSAPGQVVPVHVHPAQDEFLLVREGRFDLRLGEGWTHAGPGDLVRMPRGVPHGTYNRSAEPARALCWVSPAGRLPALFAAIDGVSDLGEVARVCAMHDVEFLPAGAG